MTRLSSRDIEDAMLEAGEGLPIDQSQWTDQDWLDYQYLLEARLDLEDMWEATLEMEDKLNVQ